jgi:hypothetical protein
MKKSWIERQRQGVGMRTLFKQSNLLLLIPIALALPACNEQHATITPAKYAPIATLSANGIGPINGNTPFNLHEITQVFQGYNVAQHTNFADGNQYPVIEVSQGIKRLMTINPDLKQDKVFSVMVQDNLIRNGLGDAIGMKFNEIYPQPKLDNCAPGMEDLEGKVLCYAPKADNVLYIFTGIWNGPNNAVPPLEVLKDWQLASIVWKPIAPKALGKPS